MVLDDDKLFSDSSYSVTTISDSVGENSAVLYHRSLGE